MASGFPGRDIYGMPAGGGGGILKRSVTEMERRQQFQQAMYMRSVKQRTLYSPISPLSPVDLSFISQGTASVFPSSISTSPLLPPAFTLLQPRRPTDLDLAAVATQVNSDLSSSSVTQNCLEELERELFTGLDDEEGVASASCAVSSSEWSEYLKIPSPPLQPPVLEPVSSSPATSSSSSCSSTASCSVPSSTPPARRLIADTAVALADGNLELAASNIAALKRTANPRGDPEQRLTEYMVCALLSRMNPPPRGPHPAPELFAPEHLAAAMTLHDISPAFTLPLVAASSAILEATRSHDKIHIVDFDIRHGGQHAWLIHALAEQRRNGRTPAVRITAVCDPFLASGSGDLLVVGEQLSRRAEQEGVGFRFNIVKQRAAEIDGAALGCEPDESLCVNLAFVLSRVPDESVSPANPRDSLLRRVRSLSPSVVTLAEQELNTNTAPFAARAAEACAHYGDLLESLDAVAPRDNRDRAAVEAALGRRAANAVAREGADRIERCEVFGKWRARMGMAGFKPNPIGPDTIGSVQNLLNSFSCNPGFTLKEEAGGLGIRWMGRVLTVASAWR